MEGVPEKERGMLYILLFGALKYAELMLNAF